jgi:glutamate synthase (NADH)
MGKVSFIEQPQKSEYDIENVEDGNPGSVFPYQETPENKSWAATLPLKQGLYDPELEKDACGVGFAAYVF